MTRLLPLLAILALFLASVTMAHAQTTTPTVSTVAVTSDPGTDDTYALGDTIEVGLTLEGAAPDAPAMGGKWRCWHRKVRASTSAEPGPWAF